MRRTRSVKRLGRRQLANRNKMMESTELMDGPIELIAAVQVLTRLAIQRADCTLAVICNYKIIDRMCSEWAGRRATGIKAPNVLRMGGTSGSIHTHTRSRHSARF